MDTLAFRAIVLPLALTSVLFAQGRNARLATSENVVSNTSIVQGAGNLWHNTPRQECRSIVVDSLGRIWTIGIESDGEETRNATRQFLALGRFEDAHWTPKLHVTQPGFVYSPAAAPDKKGGLWLAWSEFDTRADNWRVRVGYFDGHKMSATHPIGLAEGPELRPAIIVEPDGYPLIVYEQGEGHHFVLRAAKYNGARWTDETVATTDSNFRPFLTLDHEGRTWLAWDRFSGDFYHVLLRNRQNGAWQPEILFYGGGQDTERPTMRVDANNTVWVLSGRRLEGIAAGHRVTFAQSVDGSFDDFYIDSGGRFWLFQAVGNFNPTFPVTAPVSRMGLIVYDGKSRWEKIYDMPLGYRAPFLDSNGDLWNATDTVIYRLHQNLPPKIEASIGTRTAGPLAENEAPASALPSRAHRTLEIGGEIYNLYFGEMHTHLTEFPGDRLIEIWPDRFYLNARHSGVLDFASCSDHDWQWMTSSKYKIIQAYPSVLSTDGQFLALSGYEWSGDHYRRRRYGDRTIIFPHPYSPVFRITDPESDTPQKLHAKLAAIGAIDWAHHVGAPFAVMDWTTHDAVIEPVIEMVSGHGVYETYDRSKAVPVWLTKPPVGKSSIQDGLAMGKRFGLVGSSDSHSGLSGYSNGMLGIYAKALTHDAILDALRHRRTFAIRGGQPLLVDFRIDGAFMGSEFKSAKPPRIEVTVRAQSPIEKIEIVRDGQYIYTHPGGGAETKLNYQDTQIGTYYYVRVWLEGGKYAWSSPIWTK